MCHADISWLGLGVTGTRPLGITLKYWFDDRRGNLQFVNLSAGKQDDKNQIFIDYAREYGRNFMGTFWGVSAFTEEGGSGIGPNVGIETFRPLGIPRMNLSLDAGPFLVYADGKFGVAFNVRVAVRVWDSRR